MRILKYILLLLLLFLLGFSVYVATQKPNYNVVRTKYIAIPKTTLFEFVQDYQNWEGFNENVENASQNLEFSPTTEGINAFVKWDYPSSGSFTTTALQNKDSLTIKENIEGQLAIQNWKFKDSVGGTLLKVSTKGVLSFQEKVVSFFKGGPNYVIGNKLEKNLENLKNYIVTELNTHQAKVSGFVTRPKQYFLKQSIVCREKSMEKNIKIMVPKLINFFNKNEIESYGNPFLIFNKYDKANDIVAFSVCIPIKDSVFTSKNKEVEFGILESYTAIRTILKGDHRHQQKAWKKATDYIIKNQYNTNTEIPVVEVLSKYKQVKASEKVTDIYFAVFPKFNLPTVLPSNAGNYRNSDTLANSNPSVISQPKTTLNSNNAVGTPKTTVSNTTKINPKPKPKPAAKPVNTVPTDKEPIPNSDTDEFEF